MFALPVKIRWQHAGMALLLALASCTGKEKQAEEHMKQARKYIKVKQYDAAMLELNQGIDIYPQFPEAYTIRGDIKLTQLHDTAGAEKDLRNALGVNKKDTVARAVHCYILMLQRKWDDALADALHLAQDTRDQAPNLMTVGFIQNQKGNYKAGMETASQVIQMKPGLAYAWNNRGYARLKTNDLKGAGADIRRSLELDKNNAWAYRNMALYQLAMNRPDSAVIYAEKGRKAWSEDRSVFRELDSLQHVSMQGKTTRAAKK